MSQKWQFDTHVRPDLEAAPTNGDRQCDRDVQGQPQLEGPLSHRKFGLLTRQESDTESSSSTAYESAYDRTPPALAAKGPLEDDRLSPLNLQKDIEKRAKILRKYTNPPVKKGTHSGQFEESKRFNLFHSKRAQTNATNDDLEAFLDKHTDWVAGMARRLELLSAELTRTSPLEASTPVPLLASQPPPLSSFSNELPSADFAWLHVEDPNPDDLIFLCYFLGIFDVEPFQAFLTASASTYYQPRTFSSQCYGQVTVEKLTVPNPYFYYLRTDTKDSISDLLALQRRKWLRAQTNRKAKDNMLDTFQMKMEDTFFIIQVKLDLKISNEDCSLWISLRPRRSSVFKQFFTSCHHRICISSDGPHSESLPSESLSADRSACVFFTEQIASFFIWPIIAQFEIEVDFLYNFLVDFDKYCLDILNDTSTSTSTSSSGASSDKRVTSSSLPHFLLLWKLNNLTKRNALLHRHVSRWILELSSNESLINQAEIPAIIPNLPASGTSLGNPISFKSPIEKAIHLQSPGLVPSLDSLNSFELPAQASSNAPNERSFYVAPFYEPSIASFKTQKITLEAVRKRLESLKIEIPKLHASFIKRVQSFLLQSNRRTYSLFFKLL